MITISHLSGELAGQTQSFDDKKDRLVFGRDPDRCDVIYPADETVVGREHFALVQKLSGDWAVDLFGAHFVSVDGVAAEADQFVPSGSTLRLGRSDGPGFTVTYDRSLLPEELRRTSYQEAPAPVRILLRRLAIAGGAVTVALALAIGGWIVKDRADLEADRKHTAAIFASLVEEKKKAIEAEARGAEDRINSRAIDRLLRATYLVFMQDKEGRQFASGTAWVISPNLLATNSHVAAERDELKAGERLFVRQPGLKGATFEVIEHTKHPGYAAFPLYIEGKDPAFIPSFRSGAPTRLEAGIGYDVALLRVKGKLPKDSIMEVAPKEELLALAPGLPLASAGYPSENILGQSVLPMAATPEVHFGNLSALTDFLFLPTDAEHSLLIHHSIPGTGGASGSAIIGPSGHVVAFVNMNNFLCLSSSENSCERVPSGAEIAYGQRADLIVDLLQGRAEQAFEADKPYWDRQMANFKRGADVIGAWLLNKQKPDLKSGAQLVSEKKEKLEAADMQVGSEGKNQRVRVTKLDLSARETYTIIVYAENQAPVKTYLLDQDDKKVAENTSDYWYPSIKFKPPADGTWSLYVVGPDADTSFTVKVYAWRSPTS